MKTNSPQDAEILIQKLPSDMGIHRNPRKGTLNAPQKILERFEPEKDVLIGEVFPNEFDLEITQDKIRENTRELIQYGKPIISIGGDHSVSFPVLEALKQENPGMELVWLDSHLDLKEKVNGHVSHDVVVRELLNSGFSEDEVTFVGITKEDEDEKAFLQDHDIQVYRAKNLSEFIRNYSSEEPTYLSIDIDVLSREEAPGTGYPDGQLSLRQVEKVVKKVSPEYADLVEVAPSLDKEQRTIGNAKEVLTTLLNSISS